MTFEEILEQSLAMLQRRGRVTDRTRPRQFTRDDAVLEDLNEALLDVHPHVADDPRPWRALAGRDDVDPAACLLSSPACSAAGRRGPPHVPNSIGNARASWRRYGAHRDTTFMGGRGHAAAHQI